jgi:peptidoglycan hydrolase-like protein with peptidoglycan-binding domain
MPVADPASPEEVRFVQQFLAGTGHYTGGQTGTFDNATYDALVRWQRERGLSVSGRIDLATTSAMAQGIQQISRTAVDPTDKQILERYGPAMYAYRLHPEIGNILRWSAAAGYDEGRLWGLLEQTQWYRESSDSQRRWDDLNVTDPATAQQQRDQRVAMLQDSARRLGVYADPRTVNDIAEDSLTFGWDENQINDALSALIPEGTGEGIDPGGTVAVDAGSLKAEASKWLVTLGDVEAQDMAARIARGELTPDGASMLFREQAKVRFPYAGMTQLIDQGIAPSEYFREHQARIADRLGLPMQAVNWNDDRWTQVLDYADPKSGQRRPMTIPESLALLAERTDLFPEYDRSPFATGKAAQFAVNFRKTFGGVG